MALRELFRVTKEECHVTHAVKKVFTKNQIVIAKKMPFACINMAMRLRGCCSSQGGLCHNFITGYIFVKKRFTERAYKL